MESYEWWWAGQPAEASNSKLLVHGFVRRATSFFYKNPDQVEHFMRKQDQKRGDPGIPRWEGTAGSPGSLQPARGQAGDLGKGTQIQPAPGSCLIPWVVGQRGSRGEGRESPPGATLLQSEQWGDLGGLWSWPGGPQDVEGPRTRVGGVRVGDMF